jgi:hypothetical protein
MKNTSTTSIPSTVCISDLTSPILVPWIMEVVEAVKGFSEDYNAPGIAEVTF